MIEFSSRSIAAITSRSTGPISASEPAIVPGRARSTAHAVGGRRHRRSRRQRRRRAPRRGPRSPRRGPARRRTRRAEGRCRRSRRRSSPGRHPRAPTIEAAVRPGQSTWQRNGAGGAKITLMCRRKLHTAKLHAGNARTGRAERLISAAWQAAPISRKQREGEAPAGNGKGSGDAGAYRTRAPGANAAGADERSPKPGARDPRRSGTARSELHREGSGISLREFARRLGISPSAVSQIETGKARPSVSTLYAIITELGMSLDELFNSSGREVPQAAARRESRRRARSGTVSLSDGQSRVQRAGSRVVDRPRVGSALGAADGSAGS